MQYTTAADFTRALAQAQGTVLPPIASPPMSPLAKGLALQVRPLKCFEKILSDRDCTFHTCTICCFTYGYCSAVHVIVLKDSGSMYTVP